MIIFKTGDAPSYTARDGDRVGRAIDRPDAHMEPHRPRVLRLVNLTGETATIFITLRV